VETWGEQSVIDRCRNDMMYPFTLQAEGRWFLDPQSPLCTGMHGNSMDQSAKLVVHLLLGRYNLPLAKHPLVTHPRFWLASIGILPV
jgi:hypothetical protein